VAENLDLLGIAFARFYDRAARRLTDDGHMAVLGGVKRSLKVEEADGHQAYFRNLKMTIFVNVHAEKVIVRIAELPLTT
jgi:predicted enzyme involved in methoxymalonyl-ACP biosynthesis